MRPSTGSSVEQLTASFADGWNRFWFTPAEVRGCCQLRIAVGLIAALHVASLGLDLPRWFARDGLLPPAAVQTLLGGADGAATYHYSYLNYFPSGVELWIVHGAAVAAAAAFAAGLATRISGVLTLIAVLAYVHRVPQVAGHLEPALAFLLAYLCLAPCGACLSVDAWWRGRKSLGASPLAAGDGSVAANVALRLIQVHTAMFYAMMGLTKLYGDAWWDGEALWYLLAQTQSRPLNLAGLRDVGKFGEFLINAWTLGIVYFELGFPILIWNRVARPILLAAAVLVWLSLVAVTGHLLFGLAMLAASSAFVLHRSAETAR